MGDRFKVILASFQHNPIISNIHLSHRTYKGQESGNSETKTGSFEAQKSHE
jgi:hypothetical protein